MIIDDSGLIPDAMILDGGHADRAYYEGDLVWAARRAPLIVPYVAQTGTIGVEAPPWAEYLDAIALSGGGGGHGGNGGNTADGNGGEGGQFSVTRIRVDALQNRLVHLYSGLGGSPGAKDGNGGNGGNAKVTHPSGGAIVSAIGGRGGNGYNGIKNGRAPSPISFGGQNYSAGSPGTYGGGRAGTSGGIGAGGGGGAGGIFGQSHKGGAGGPACVWIVWRTRHLNN